MSYTGAVTLTQFAQMSNPPLVQAVTFSLIESGNVRVAVVHRLGAHAAPPAKRLRLA
jgi:hypothetical protein